jgi:hypothetical protein
MHIDKMLQRIWIKKVNNAFALIHRCLHFGLLLQVHS